MNHNIKNSLALCPKTHEYKNLESDFPDQRFSSHDIISKDELECGVDCDISPCPIVERHNNVR